MMQMIVEQPGNASLSMVGPILDFALDHILPMLQQESITNNSEISTLVYSLFDR